MRSLQFRFRILTYINTTIIFITISVLLSACNDNRSCIERKIHSFNILEKYERASNWDFDLYSFGDVTQVSVFDTVGNTSRILELSFSNQKNYPQYFDNEGFLYRGERLSFNDSNFNTHSIAVYKGDTLYHLLQVHDSLKNGGNQLEFLSGEKYYRYLVLSEFDLNVNSRTLGEWSVNTPIGDYQIQFKMDSLYVIENESREYLSEKKYYVDDKGAIRVELNSQEVIYIEKFYSYYFKYYYDSAEYWGYRQSYRF